MNDLAIMFDRELGSLVRLHRIAKGSSQEDLAEKTGLTTAQIAHYEAGTNRLSVFRFWEVMQALGQEPSRVLRQLTERLSFATERRAAVEQKGLDFLATNRGHQIVRALAMCEEPEVLDVLADLILAVSVHEHGRMGPSASRAKTATIKTENTN